VIERLTERALELLARFQQRYARNDMTETLRDFP